MSLHTHIPGWPLSQWVELFWLTEDYRPAHEVERVLPTGAAQLIVMLEPSGSRPAAVLLAPRSEWFTLRAQDQRSVIGVQFKPEGVFPFLPCPVAALGAGGQIELDDLWGSLACELRERVSEAGTPAGKFAAVEQILLNRKPMNRLIDPAIAFAVNRFVRQPEGQRVSDLAEQAGLSQRWFVQRFTEQVGLSPKRFARIQRFRYAIGVLASTRQVDWPQLALSCGYYDQAHFIQDFRAFSGLTPTAYRKSAGEHPNHLPHD